MPLSRSFQFISSIIRSSSERARGYFLLVVLSAIAAMLYWRGLAGGYTFDDFPNIVSNTVLHVTNLDASAWFAATFSSPSSDLQRPLAMLSFAANHYFSGLDPWPMKFTNLVIHLLNGFLLYLLLRRIVPALARCDNPSENVAPSRTAWIALLVTGAWLLHPINLTSVLYVVQRMESLAQVFVLLGLILYSDARERQDSSRPGAMWRLWIGVPLCMALGVASKESAITLPLYAFIVECVSARTQPRPSRQLAIFFSLFLFIPGLLGTLWLLQSDVLPTAYASRAFTLTQRLLTEPRVLLDYTLWTLLPAPGFFSFLRDDYPISTSAWQPWSTLPALISLLAAAGVAVLLRRRRPLFTLGIAWFFAAHALTATIIPLELVFEHRNYFASIGLLMAAFDLVLPSNKSAAFAWARIFAVVSFLLLCSFTLNLRANEWSDPVKLDVVEAARHPESPRATYALGRTYVVLSNYRKDSPNLPRAIAALEVAARVPRATLLPEVSLIMVASHTGQPIDDKIWESMFAKLEHRHTTPEDAEAIKSLTACQRTGDCLLDDRRMLRLYLAAISRGTPDPSVLYSYAIFAFNRLQDAELATSLARGAARSRDPQYQLNLVNFLIDRGNLDDAHSELLVLKGKSRTLAMKPEIAAAERRLNDVMLRRGASGDKNSNNQGGK